MSKHKNLVIVESPAKGKTIEKFLGPDYQVLSSYGHIRDIPAKGMNVDIENKFEPTYAVSPDKTKTVRELKKAAKEAETVWLASDEDREGEAIAWHLTEALGLDASKTKRIVFHEITKPAIEKAVANPRTVDKNLVDAQQARRILDRIVGYELSPVLWKKVQTGLSAGRVQSVAVRLIVEREQEIEKHEIETTYKVIAEFKGQNGDIPAELSKKLKNNDEAKQFLIDCIDSEFEVKSIEQSPGKRNPSPPFTTSTLQQAASQKLGFSVKQTMQLAQRLYEAGNITYMRTDSMNLSQTAHSAIKKYVVSKFGENYYNQRFYKTKSAGAQEAHEAIRPTSFETETAGADDRQKKLYSLIRSRAMASQMSPAIVDKTTAKILISKREEMFVAKGEVLNFDGFMRVYKLSRKDIILPEMIEGEKLQREVITATENFSKSSARYSEAALVKKLEELGIGRPSTYAPTISTIQDRGYIEKGDVEGKEQPVKSLVLEGSKIEEKEEMIMQGADQNKLLPTPLAELVTGFLVKHFDTILDYGFTSDVEAEFDNIADGKLKWQDMLEKFYKGFHKYIEKAENIERDEVSNARVLGKDPKSGKNVIARFGRFGPMLQIGEAKNKDGTEAEEKPRFAPMPKDANLKTVTLEQALKMFELPRLVGKTEKDEEITADIGRFGPYIKIGKTFVSIKEVSPFKVTESEARKLYEEKLKQIKDRDIADFGKIKIIKGPFGPYITDGKKNAKIPKELEPKNITEAEAKKILAEAPDKKRRFPKKKRK
ncbi:MAG: type I DNA topoisomerase [bacterium]|nr:type I DNA topoisomerase [bacterium]